MTDLLEKVASAWRDLLAAYAGAMCSAQILERELVQILALLRMGSGELSGSDFEWAYLQMTRMKPSEVLNSIRGAGGNLSREKQEVIKSAMRERNFLAHEFFHKYNLATLGAAQSTKIVRQLYKINSNLKVAFESLNPLREQLVMPLGLSEDRSVISENFRKQVAEAIVSFNDD